MKVQENLSILEDDALTKAVQLPKSHSKTMHFFHQCKPNKDGRRACTNIRVLDTEDMQSIISTLRYELEVEEITSGSKLVHHHDVIKIGCILGIMDKINLQ